MWVLVRERIDNGYLGILDNDPYSVAENNDFWSGIELPFEPQHIINIAERDDKTIAIAAQEPRKRWI